MKFDLPVNTNIYGMTYSPLDKAFVMVVPTTDTTSDLYTIDPLNPRLEKQTTLDNTVQYRILVTPDVILAPETPVTAEIISLDFKDGSTSGSATIKFPSTTFDGSTLSGNLTLATYIDGEKHSETYGQPGETIEVKFDNIEEGIRRFSFSVISGELESAKVDISLYVGYDTPLPPQNIELKEGILTWDAPEGTVNNGYLDVANLTYNVYLNGERINDTPVVGCSYTFTMPDALYQKYVAQVEAVNHGHNSDKGFSNDIKSGNPFPLPFFMTPTETEGELVTAITQRNEYYAWYPTQDYNNERLFQCYTTDYDGPRPEWLYLPAISVPESDNLLEISFDMQTGDYEGYLENLSVGFGKTQDPNDITIIQEWNGLGNSDWVRMTAYCLPEQGKTYIAFLTNTSENGYMVRIRNISIKVSDRPATTPAAPSNLTAEALPEGVLKAKVSFTMPTLNAAGGELKDNSLTATVKTAAETKTVTGAPGTEQSLVIATIEGANEITVIVSNDNEGLEAKTSVFTGLDIPNPISVFKSGRTADFKGIHIEWEDPTTGVNGGYVNPEKVTYALCLYNEEEYQWQIVKELGDVNSYDAIFEGVEGIILAEIGILAQNEKGNCGTFLTVSETVGNPYTLPMEETFSENYGDKYYGTVTINNDNDNCWWGYVYEAYPYWIDKNSPYGSGAYCASGCDNQKARVILPAFSTVGVSSAGIEIPLYAQKGNGLINVYAKAYGIEPELIGTFEGTENSEWAKRRFHLPAKFCNREWVEIIIDAEFSSQEETTMAFAQYKIQTFVSNDIAVTDINVPTFPLVGETYEITAKIENSGLDTVDSPALNLQIAGADKTPVSLTMTRTDGAESLPELGEAEYKAEWTPTAEFTGNVILTVSTASHDMNPINDSMTATATLSRGNAPVVTDLVAEEKETGVELTWTEPTIETGHEGFEGFASFCYRDRMGDFKFVNLDGEQSMYFANFTFPYQADCKAWQVIGEKDMTEIIESAGMENDFLHAYDGDKFLTAFAPFTIYVGAGLVADRWVISPEIKGGSKFSFYMSSGVSGYFEYVDILYSNSGDNPEDFTAIEQLKLLSPEWKNYEFTLPEDAKYFAIRYKGNSDESFFVLLDDIRYEPTEYGAVIEGYDIIRNGNLIAENVKVSGNDGIATYTDGFKPDGASTYNVTPVINKNGSISRGLISNTASILLSAIDDVKVETVADEDCEYYSIQGFRVEKPVKGIYIKRNGTKAMKVIIK